MTSTINAMPVHCCNCRSGDTAALFENGKLQHAAHPTGNSGRGTATTISSALDVLQDNGTLVQANRINTSCGIPITTAIPRLPSGP